ncbi:MAG: hypothetical protein K0B87_02055 [Candidatus Syntrophosphaera sp.]|nr:hypothetical protein [Candidatus Syntrophosphaera sp.]
MSKTCLVLSILTLCLAFLSAQSGPADVQEAEGNIDSDDEYVQNMYQKGEADSIKADPQYLSADQALFVMPTAYTMPRGTSALTSFELLILQYTYAPTDRIHLSAGTVFPITFDLLRSFTLGGKINYLRKDGIQAAFYGSFTPDVEVRIANIGHVLSIGDPHRSLHFSVSKPFGEYEDILEGGFVFGLGGIADLSKRVAAIGEFYLYAGEGDTAQILASVCVSRGPRSVGTWADSVLWATIWEALSPCPLSRQHFCSNAMEAPDPQTGAKPGDRF